MREIKEWFREMDHEERKDAIEGFVGFGCLFAMVWIMMAAGCAAGIN